MPKKLPYSRKKPHRFLKFYIFLGLSIFLVAAFQFIKLPKSNTTTECANSISCISNLSGKYEENATEGTFLNKLVTVPRFLASLPQETAVLGETTANKQIYVDLSSQHLYAFQDNKLVYDFPVSTGKWGATPVGSFNIWVKLRYTRMSGGNPEKGTYYNLPNVPYTMFFYNKDVPKTMGYGIHGAYWHNNFGQPMSHGCINMKTEEVEKIYNWANPPSESYITYATKDTPGTSLIIYGESPDM